MRERERESDIDLLRRRDVQRSKRREGMARYLEAERVKLEG